MLEDFFNSNEPLLRYLLPVLIIVVIAIVVTRTLRWLISKLYSKEQLQNPADATRLKFFKNGISMMVWLVALACIIYMIPRLRAIAVTLFAGAGILLAIIGFAAQQAFANIIGGIFIVIFKPFRIGDFIKVGSLDYGIVEDITLRHTVIKSFENKRIVIPNSVISSENIVNDTISDPKICRWVEVGISYDSDIDLAMKIIREEAMNNPLHIDNRTNEQKAEGVPEVDVRVVELGEYSINLRAYVWTGNALDSFAMHHALNKSIKERFDREGIEIPFPYRTLVYKKDLLEENQKHGQG